MLAISRQSELYPSAWIYWMSEFAKASGAFTEINRNKLRQQLLFLSLFFLLKEPVPVCLLEINMENNFTIQPSGFVLHTRMLLR